MQHIYYGNRGDLGQSPFAALSDDVQRPGGAEELTIDRWVAGSDYSIAVHAYASDAELAGSDARVLITRSGNQPQALLCPTSGNGDWPRSPRLP